MKKDILIENFNDVKLLTESVDNKKKHIIEGVFAQANVRLKNPHIYPRPLLERESRIFTESYIKNGTAWGELGHRDKLDFCEDRVCIHVDELTWDKDNLLGRATVLDNDNGRKYISMIDVGKPGVSTRGGGTLKGQIVQPDYRLLYWDAVGRPSADSVMRLMTEDIDLWDISEIEYDMFKKIIKSDKDNAKVIKNNIVEWFNKTLNKFKI